MFGPVCWLFYWSLSYSLWLFDTYLWPKGMRVHWFLCIFVSWMEMLMGSANLPTVKCCMIHVNKHWIVFLGPHASGSIPENQKHTWFKFSSGRSLVKCCTASSPFSAFRSHHGSPHSDCLLSFNMHTEYFEEYLSSKSLSFYFPLLFSLLSWYWKCFGCVVFFIFLNCWYNDGENAV